MSKIRLFFLFSEEGSTPQGIILLFMEANAFVRVDPFQKGTVYGETNMKSQKLSPL